MREYIQIYIYIYMKLLNQYKKKSQIKEFIKKKICLKKSKI